MTNFISLNTKIIPDTEGSISITDRGFLYGDGIFETIRSYNGTPFKLNEHIERLRNSSGKLKIVFEYTNSEIGDNIKALIEKNNIQNAYIRITLSRGVGGSGLGISDNHKPTLLIQAKPFTPYENKLYDEGMTLVVSKSRRSTSCSISCHKTTNLLKSIMLKEEANTKSANEVVILNTDGFVAECVVSNIFIVNNGSVTTPSLDTNILPGITRRTILDICNNSSIPASEEHFTKETLIKSDEIFITNSLMEIMPVSRIDEHKIGRVIPGEITQHLMNAYKQLTEKSL